MGWPPQPVGDQPVCCVWSASAVTEFIIIYIIPSGLLYRSYSLDPGRMLPPLGNRTRDVRSRQYQHHHQPQYRSPRRSLLSSSRATHRHPYSRASSRSSFAGRQSTNPSIYSVDPEVWDINRTPAPPSEISYNLGSITPTQARDVSSSLRSPRPPSHPHPPHPHPPQYDLKLHPRPPQQSQQKQQQKINFDHEATNRTTIRPAPYSRRIRQQHRQRRLDERQERYLEKRRAREQQNEIEELEREIKRQDQELHRAQVHEESQHQFNQQRAVKGMDLVRRMRDRHVKYGNKKEAGLLNSVLHECKKGGGGGIFGRKLARPQKIVLIPNLRSTDDRRLP